MPAGLRHSDLACVALLTGLAFLLCHGAIGGVFFERDIHLVWHAQVEAFVRCLAAGSWPVWNPWTGFGTPMLANPSAQVLYPPTWLNLILRPWTYYNLYAASHLAFAGFGFFLFCRRFRLTHGASLGAAAVWMGSGPLLSLLNVWHHFAGAAWMPWVLLAVKEVMEAVRPLHAALWGIVLAGQVLAGSPDMSFMTVALASAFAAAHFDRSQLWGERNKGRLLRLALFGLMATGLTAGQWLPTLASALESARFDLPAERRAFWSVHPLALAQLILPVSFEDLPRSVAWATPHFELWSPFLRSIYLGLPAAILASAAAAKRRPYRNLFAVSAIAALCFALGSDTPFHAAASGLLPPLQVLRYPSKAMVVVAFCFALLAGMGIEALGPGAGRRLFLVAPAVGSALVLALLSSSLPVGWLAAGSLPWLTGLAALLASLLAIGGMAGRGHALAVLAVLDLTGAHWFLNPTTRKELFTYRPEILDVFPRGRATRLHVWDYVMPVPGARPRTPNRLALFYENPQGWPRRVGAAMAMQSYLYPPSAGRFGLQGSYDPDLLDLGERRLTDMNLLVRSSGATVAYRRLMGIGSVDYVVALHDEGFDDLERVTTLPGLYSEPIRVFRVPGTQPRAYVVGASRVAAEPESYRALLDASFDPSREVVLSEGEPKAVKAGFEGRAKIVEARADTVRIEADASEAGYLVLVDAYSPGWHATVDGRAAPILRANVLFRAVPIPPGRHLLEFRYRPTSVSLGLASSAVSLAGWAFLLARHRSRGSRTAPLPRPG